MVGFSWGDASVDYFQCAAAALVVLWSVLLAQHWKGEEAVIATKWGTDGELRAGPTRTGFFAQTVGDQGSTEWFVCGVKNPLGGEGLYYEVMAALGQPAPNTKEDYQRNTVAPSCFPICAARAFLAPPFTIARFR